MLTTDSFAKFRVDEIDYLDFENRISVTKIADFALAKLHKLKTFEGNNIGLTTIERNSFSGTTNLKTLFLDCLNRRELF